MLSIMAGAAWQQMADNGGWSRAQGLRGGWAGGAGRAQLGMGFGFNLEVWSQ